MKLHIECLQEKLDQVTKERDYIKDKSDKNMNENSINIEKLNKIVKTLEEELTEKVEKIKGNDIKLNLLKEENMSLIDRIKDLQKSYDKLKRER